MPLHVAPHIDLARTAEQAAHHLADQVRELGHYVPGYELWRGGIISAMARRVAEAATPVLIHLALGAATLVEGSKRRGGVATQ